MGNGVKGTENMNGLTKDVREQREAEIYSGENTRGNTDGQHLEGIKGQRMNKAKYDKKQKYEKKS